MTLPPDTLDLWIASTRRNADSWTARNILAQYLSLQSERVQIVRPATGKPVLDASHRSPLHFSVSHARGTLLIGIAHRPLGVDVESTIDLDRRPLEGVLRYLTPNERATLQAIPAPQRAFATLTCWTRKEAYAKADGRGLSIGFDRFEVSPPDADPCLIRCDDDPDEIARWALLPLPPVPDVIGTIAIQAPAPGEMRVRHWYEA